MTAEAENLGGNGGGPDHLTPAELNLLARSVSRFPISSKERKKAVKACMKVMKVKSPRTVLAGVRTLAVLDAMNMEQEKRDAGGETVNLNLNGKLSVEAEVTKSVTKYARLFGLIPDSRGSEDGPASENGAAEPVHPPGTNGKAS